MYSDDVYKKLRKWSEQTLFLLRELLPKMTPIARHDAWTAVQRRTLGELLSATARSSESAMLLTSYGQLWDAEIMVRSVFEGTLKFVYLLQAPETFEDRHNEYSHDLFRIGLLKDHTKYAELLSVIPSRADARWRPLRDRLLSDAERDEIATAYPKPIRSALESRWGFTGLIGALSRSGDQLFHGATGLASSYAMASHIAHADSIGTSVPLDIDKRSDARRNAILLAHGVRLMSDVLSCFQVRLAVGYRFVGQDATPVTQALEAIDGLRASFGPIYEEWMSAEYDSKNDVSDGAPI